MAASSSGAIKAMLEATSEWKPLDVGVPVFRDRVPQSQAYPYVTVSEALSVVPHQRGDNGKGTAGRELVQVDVWQQWVDKTTDRTVERYGLAAAIARTLHGSKLPAAPDTVYGVHVSGRVRMVDDDNNTVHDALSVYIERRF